MRLSQVSKKLDDIISTLLENKVPDHKKLAEVYHLSHYLPYKWYDDRNDIYISYTSLGLIFEVMPLVGNSEAMQKELSNIFTQILPEESNIQIMFFASQNIRHDLLNYVYSRQNSSDTLQRLARRRAEFLDTLTQKSHLYPYILRDFRVFVSINIPISGGFKTTKEEIISIKKQIEATLNIVGMCYFLLKPTPLMELIDEIFNRDISKQNYDEVRRIWNPLDALNIQMLSQELDLKVEEDILKLHDENTEIKRSQWLPSGMDAVSDD